MNCRFDDMPTMTRTAQVVAAQVVAAQVVAAKAVAAKAVVRALSSMLSAIHGAGRPRC